MQAAGKKEYVYGVTFCNLNMNKLDPGLMAEIILLQGLLISQYVLHGLSYGLAKDHLTNGVHIIWS